MTTHILVITQTKIGSELLKAIKNTYGELPLPINAVCIGNCHNPNNYVKTLHNTIKKVNKNTDILILTDLYGSTPSNLAHKLQNNYSNAIRIVSGVNLPMLIKIMNYADLPLNDLVKKAIEGGKKGILDCSDIDIEKINLSSE